MVGVPLFNRCDCMARSRGSAGRSSAPSGGGSPFGAGRQADEQRRQRRHHRTEGEVLEPRRNQIGDSPAAIARDQAACALHACTTCSIFAKRDPFRSTRAHAGQGLRTAASSVPCRRNAAPPARRPGRHGRSRPSPRQTRSMPLWCACAPASAWKPAPGCPPRPCRPAPAGAGRADRPARLDGGAHRVRVGVVAVVHQGEAPACRSASGPARERP